METSVELVKQYPAKWKRNRPYQGQKWTILTIPRGQTHIQTEFALETKLEYVIKQLTDIKVNFRLEYIRDHVNVQASNGQRICIKVI